MSHANRCQRENEIFCSSPSEIVSIPSATPFEVIQRVLPHQISLVLGNADWFYCNLSLFSSEELDPHQKKPCGEP